MTLRHFITGCVACAIWWAQNPQRPAKAQPPQSAAADEKSSGSAEGRQNPGGAAAGSDQVLAFAREHHPELAELLVQLRRARSPEFQRAIRELSSQVERIERIRERTPARFEAELSAWKTDSQIRLLVARWAMSQDPALELRIRELLEGRRKQRREQLQQEQERLQQRLSQVSSQLDTLNAGNDEYVNEEFARLTRRITAARESRASGKGSSAKESTRTPPPGEARPPAERKKPDH